jgi:hypothetical protein
MAGSAMAPVSGRIAVAFPRRHGSRGPEFA